MYMMVVWCMFLVKATMLVKPLDVLYMVVLCHVILLVEVYLI